MTIRPATERDIPLLRELADRIWRACYPGIITPEQIEFMLRWMYSEDTIRRELREGCTWEVVEENGAAAGFLSFSRDADGRVKLHKMYILPERQRRGLGQHLLAHVCESARSLGASAVWMQVNKRNARAIGAYLKAGFRIEKEAVFDIGGGFVMDDYLMVRSVEHDSAETRLTPAAPAE
jgi:ribosomal protein S18 acetylase RimI-like enzyme